MSLQQRLNSFEIPVCLFFNRINHRQAISRFFAIISRLGDGVFWYSLMAVLPILYGETGLHASLHMLVVGGSCLTIYKLMKSKTKRIRPYQYHDTILRNVAALDQFSFPSGHTLHAVGFTWVAVSYFPVLTWLLLPFTICVALSRLVLGLHYPSDVLIGAALGISIASSSFILLAFIII